MDIEILFLDRRGSFCCSLQADFMTPEAAAGYARCVMQTRLCRHYASAEIYVAGSLLPDRVLRAGDSRFVGLRGRLKHDDGMAKPASCENAHATLLPQLRRHAGNR